MAMAKDTHKAMDHHNSIMAVLPMGNRDIPLRASHLQIMVNHPITPQGIVISESICPLL